MNKAPQTIAVRITYRVVGQLPLTAALNTDPPIIYTGDLGALDAQRSKVVLADGPAARVRALAISSGRVTGQRYPYNFCAFWFGVTLADNTNRNSGA
jgi:hypothetical protein